MMELTMNTNTADSRIGSHSDIIGTIGASCYTGSGKEPNVAQRGWLR